MKTKHTRKKQNRKFSGAYQEFCALYTVKANHLLYFYSNDQYAGNPGRITKTILIKKTFKIFLVLQSHNPKKLYNKTKIFCMYEFNFKTYIKKHIYLDFFYEVV